MQDDNMEGVLFQTHLGASLKSGAEDPEEISLRFFDAERSSEKDLENSQEMPQPNLKMSPYITGLGGSSEGIGEGFFLKKREETLDGC